MRLPDEEAKVLVSHALEARRRAYAPYSHYPVGAALRTAGGAIVYGCNVENAAYPSTLCAERVALTAAIAQGHRSFEAIAVATRDGGSPCGGCRQVLSELCPPDMTVLVADEHGAYRATTVGELLPGAFNAGSLQTHPAD